VDHHGGLADVVIVYFCGTCHRPVVSPSWRAAVGLDERRSARHIRLMPPSPQRLDPDRRRRRLELLAALADAKSARERTQPQRLRGARIRELIATRRRFVS
jgi:hypothetical protein